MDGYLVRELYQSEGETLLPPDLPRLYQQPHQAPLRQDFTVQTHFSGFAEVLQEAAQQRQSRADREQEAEQGPESQDRTEFPSDHRLCYGVGQGTETILTNSTESCVLLTVEHKEKKTLPVEQLASFLRGLRKVEYSCSTMWSWSPACAGELLGLQ